MYRLAVAFAVASMFAASAVAQNAVVVQQVPALEHPWDTPMQA